MTAGELHVWPLVLAELPELLLPAAGAEECARAERFVFEEDRRRYLLSHRALRAILGRVTGAPLDFAQGEHGKPFLPGAREVQFNLSHSGDMAMVGVAMGVEVGVDIERLHSMPDYLAVAERFFPASESSALAVVEESQREREFFRRWTRIEAVLKARGVGLFGAGAEADENWTVAEIAAPEGYAAAVAAPRAGLAVKLRRFGDE